MRLLIQEVYVPNVLLLRQNWTVRDPVGELWLLGYTQRKCCALLAAYSSIVTDVHRVCSCLCVNAAVSVASVACCPRCFSTRSGKRQMFETISLLRHSLPWVGSECLFTRLLLTVLPLVRGWRAHPDHTYLSSSESPYVRDVKGHCDLTPATCDGSFCSVYYPVSPSLPAGDVLALPSRMGILSLPSYPLWVGTCPSRSHSMTVVGIVSRHSLPCFFHFHMVLRTPQSLALENR